MFDVRQSHMITLPKKPTRHLLIIAGVVTLQFLFFIDKPFHIDDTIFLEGAKQILSDPIRPYDRVINWYFYPEPMWEVNQNPPGNSYLLAAIAFMFGFLGSVIICDCRTSNILQYEKVCR